MTSDQSHEQPRITETHESQAFVTAYPIILSNLRGAPVVVVGGGPVGER